MSIDNNLIVIGNIDPMLIKRAYRLLTTVAGSLPFDRNFGIDMSVLDNTPSAIEGALLVEYSEKLIQYYPNLTISELTFSYEGNSIIPKVVLAYV